MDQGLERFSHLPHGLNAPLQLGDMRLSQTLDVRALARLVVPQSQQIGDLGHREPKVAGAADEVQPVDVRLGVGTVAGIGPVRGVESGPICS